MDYLITARPTAVNIYDAFIKLKKFVLQLEKETNDLNLFKLKYLNASLKIDILLSYHQNFILD